MGDAIRVKHGFAFKGKHFADKGTHVVLTPGNFHEKGGFRERPGRDRYYNGEIPDEYILDEGDLVVAMTEQGPGLLGSSALIPEGMKYLHNQRLGLVSIEDESVLDKGFLYYLFNTRTVRAQINASATGTKVRHTAPERIYNVTEFVPSDLIEQQWIGEALSTYDELIENNKRRIQMLEQAARLLYEEWFVHLRFPGHDRVAIINGVPKEWQRKTIAEICDTVGGGTPSTKVSEYWDGDITWVVPSDLTGNDCLVLLDSERKISDRGLRESSAKMVPAETILMTSRASVGFFALMDREVCTNQGFINVIPHEEKMRMYLLFNLMSRVAEIRSNAKGTTYPEISKRRFRALDIVIPTRTLMRRFADLAYNTVLEVRFLKRSIRRLTHARDLLLPRLMSGELSV